MKLLHLSIQFLLASFTIDKSKCQEANNELTKYFEMYFSPESTKNFFNEQVKALKLLDGLPDGDKDKEIEKQEATDTKLENKETKKNVKGVPVGGKVFIYYGRLYKCGQSKIFQEFQKRLENDELPCPKVKEDVNTAWLEKMKNLKVDVDGSATVTVEEANEKLNKLQPEQRKILEEGESMIPLCPELLVRFVKRVGCPDTKFEDYKKYNMMFGEELEKLKNTSKMFPSSYYLAKADVMLLENF